MEVMSFIVLSIIILILILRKRYNAQFVYYVSMLDHLPSLPGGIFYSILKVFFWLTFFLGSLFFTLLYPWLSISIWIVLLVFIPFWGVYFSYKKLSKQFLSIAFCLYIFLTINHLAHLNKIRDEIGTQFSSEYAVEYQEVWVGGKTVDGDYENWKENKPIFNNSNPKLVFFWESVFPAIYVYGTFALVFGSFILFTFMSSKGKHTNMRPPGI